MDSVALCKQRLLQGDERSLAVCHSLEAFVCYQLMYKDWWRHSCSGTTKASSNKQMNGQQTPVENGGTSHEREIGSQSEAQDIKAIIRSEDFWKVLLSEPHANLQAIQRAISNIQSRVAKLVQQHNSPQEPQSSLGSQPVDLTVGPTGSEGPGDLENNQRYGRSLSMLKF